MANIATPEELVGLIKVMNKKDFMDTLSLFIGYHNGKTGEVDEDLSCPWGDPKNDEERKAVLMANMDNINSKILLVLTNTMTKIEKTQGREAPMYNMTKGMIMMLLTIYRAAINKSFDEVDSYEI